jgi:cobalt transporter subunit CbtB
VVSRFSFVTVPLCCSDAASGWFQSGSGPSEGKLMAIITGASAHDTDTSDSTTGSRLWRDRILPGLTAFVLGAALIYAAGFASAVELHNAAHDGRHSAGFPCH